PRRLRRGAHRPQGRPADRLGGDRAAAGPAARGRRHPVLRPRPRLPDPVRRQAPRRRGRTVSAMGPSVIMAVRHGASAARGAFAAAARRGEPLAFPRPDSAVPLTDRGRKQAAALGRWLAALPEGRRPQVAWTSTYLRARETLRIVCEQ